MSINLLEAIQKQLNYPPLKKIDPTTEEVVADSNQPSEHRFSQASIPTVLTGLYQYSGKDNGAESILRGDISSDWASEIFGEEKDEVVGKISKYSFQSNEGITTNKINEIATEAIQMVRGELGPDATIMDVKNLMSAQTTNLFAYLPSALHIGKTLHEETVDDNTNKMEGPVSSLIKKIGSAFSNPSNDEEVNTPN